VNTLEDLAALAPGLGAEIDLRTRGDEIVLNHEAFADGLPFAAFLSAWVAGPARGTLILNPKEDGLEGRAVARAEAAGVTDFFFLDLTIPTTVRMAVREGFRRIAIRVSEYEPAEAALRFAGLADWAWLDCFDGVPAPDAVVDALAGRFRICLVSPELEGYPRDRIAAFLPLAARADAVCTKFPSDWGFVAPETR
jgi:hypothetical protein